MNSDIGKQVHDLRKAKKITLKELSEKTQLSTGFLSQFERGMTSIAIDSLQKIAKILDVDIDGFFHKPQGKNEDIPILRSFDREIGSISSKYIQYNLLQDIESAELLPRIYEVLPKTQEGHAQEYRHKGSELIYVLEGVLTLIYKGKSYEMYPDDSAYLDSTMPHNWENNTNKKVKILVINTPNPLKDAN